MASGSIHVRRFHRPRKIAHVMYDHLGARRRRAAQWRFSLSIVRLLEIPRGRNERLLPLARREPMKPVSRGVSDEVERRKHTITADNGPERAQARGREKRRKSASAAVPADEIGTGRKGESGDVTRRRGGGAAIDLLRGQRRREIFITLRHGATRSRAKAARRGAVSVTADFVAMLEPVLRRTRLSEKQRRLDVRKINRTKSPDKREFAIQIILLPPRLFILGGTSRDDQPSSVRLREVRGRSFSVRRCPHRVLAAAARRGRLKMKAAIVSIHPPSVPVPSKSLLYSRRDVAIADEWQSAMASMYRLCLGCGRATLMILDDIGSVTMP